VSTGARRRLVNGVCVALAVVPSSCTAGRDGLSVSDVVRPGSPGMAKVVISSYMLDDSVTRSFNGEVQCDSDTCYFTPFSHGTGPFALPSGRIRALHQVKSTPTGGVVAAAITGAMLAAALFLVSLRAMGNY